MCSNLPVLNRKTASTIMRKSVFEVFSEITSFIDATRIYEKSLYVVFSKNTIFQIPQEFKNRVFPRLKPGSTQW